jgi:ElaB/YqjD/DUF883 family membrane-anchored ribosome-binding protein
MSNLDDQIDAAKERMNKRIDDAQDRMDKRIDKAKERMHEKIDEAVETTVEETAKYVLLYTGALALFFILLGAFVSYLGVT